MEMEGSFLLTEANTAALTSLSDTPGVANLVGVHPAGVLKSVCVCVCVCM